MRFCEGSLSDAYLQRRGPSLGYTIVVFRGRHAADLVDLPGEELFQFWREVQRTASILVRAFAPCHMNYQVLGNSVPHLHVHLTPRYLDDPAPGRPLTFADRYERVQEEEFARQLERLRAADGG